MIVGDEIGKNNAVQLGKELESAHEVEQLYYSLKGSPTRLAQLTKLEEAAGLFIGLANSIRAAP